MADDEKAAEASMAEAMVEEDTNAVMDEKVKTEKEEAESAQVTEEVKDQPASEEAAQPPLRSTRKRSASPRGSSPTENMADATAAAAQAQAAAVSAAAAAAGAHAALTCNMTGLYTLLTSTTSGGLAVPATTMPSVEQVKQAATRAVNDSPPYVHLSSRDSAPQLKIEDGPVGRRLLLRGGMRGYRMARATHGVTEGNYYFEVLILPSPTAKELVARLPPNVRLGKNFQKQLQEQLVREQQELEQASGDKESDGEKTKLKKRKLGDEETQPPSVGGHVRIGWSMRTGDLQAPVGYDKWSYGLRDIMGSRCHNSKREDQWGGEPFGEGDVVGFAISLVGPDNKSGQDDAGGGAASSTPKKGVWTNHIRFFKNGEAMGHFIISKGKREGGAAFDNIEDGTYYPAISAYMGGSVRANFGPHFVYPPRMLPSGMKVRPVSDLCAPPPSPEEAVAKAMKERAFSKKTDESQINAFRDAVLTEAQIRFDAYTNHLSRHVEEVREARQERNLSAGDLPASTTTNEDSGDVQDMEVETSIQVSSG